MPHVSLSLSPDSFIVAWLLLLLFAFLLRFYSASAVSLVFFFFRSLSSRRVSYRRGKTERAEWILVILALYSN